ncbi:conserved hypothetical protein [Beggiatoa sp. PS]|nr:conserved hypothetical protein [Beggiatoa sp. PS]
MLSKIPWQNRPFEIRNLLNPYFCTTLIWESVDGFCKEKKEGMSFSLAFLVLPFILHNDIREKLPNSKETKLLSRIEKINKETFIRIPTYCHNLAPYTRESIILGTQQQCLFINDEGLLQSSRTLSKQEELEEYRKKAQVLGQLFASTSPEIIFRTLELTP